MALCRARGGRGHEGALPAGEQPRALLLPASVWSAAVLLPLNSPLCTLPCMRDHPAAGLRHTAAALPPAARQSRRRGGPPLPP